MLAEIALLPRAASTTAGEVDRLTLFLTAVCGGVGLLVAFLLIFFSIRYRRRPQHQLPLPETKSPHWLEWFWTITPVFAFAAMFVWGAEVYWDAYRAPDDATPVYVIGRQWMWKFQHPEGQREINALHIPVGRPIKLIQTSEDVIHSVYIPAFRTKMDVLPERYTTHWFHATQAGTYHLFCAEYCGTNHSGMIGEVIAMEPADYESWLQLNAEGSLGLEGRKVFLKYRCVACHSADENARGPVLENLFGRPVNLRDGRRVRADENYIRESILHPGAQIVAGYQDIMPTFRGQISEDEIIALISYFKSLETGQTPRRVEDYPPPADTPPINSQD